MNHTPHLVECINCRENFDIGAGYILLHICPECLRKPPKPEPFIERNGLLVPNPAAIEGTQV